MPFRNWPVVCPRTVSDALAFMHENYAREVSLTDIAGTVHLSPFHLARLFKQSLGVSRTST
jgi:AraC-like DNA-binding protein